MYTANHSDQELAKLKDAQGLQILKLSNVEYYYLGINKRNGWKISVQRP